MVFNPFWEGGGVSNFQGRREPWEKAGISLIVFVILLMKALLNHEKFKNNVTNVTNS